MRCDQAYELIGACLDEELSGGDRTSVADHIESCAGCRVLISDIKRTSTAVLSWLPMDAMSSPLAPKHLHDNGPEHPRNDIWRAPLARIDCTVFRPAPFCGGTRQRSFIRLERSAAPRCECGRGNATAPARSTAYRWQPSRPRSLSPPAILDDKEPHSGACRLPLLPSGSAGQPAFLEPAQARAGAPRRTRR